jgi:hypothetical protein
VTVERVAVGPLRFPARTVRLLGAAIAVEAVAMAAYLLVVDPQVVAVRYLVYPFVWMNVALVAVARTAPAGGSGRTRAVGGLVALSYLAVLSVTAGVVTESAMAASARVVWALPPGWGPALLIHGGGLRAALLPYEAVGYATLGYLVYATVVEARGVLGGAVGLVSCVGCTVPVAAGVVGAVVGGGVAVGATTWAYDLSTVAYVVAVALLSR